MLAGYFACHFLNLGSAHNPHVFGVRSGCALSVSKPSVAITPDGHGCEILRTGYFTGNMI